MLCPHSHFAIVPLQSCPTFFKWWWKYPSILWEYNSKVSLSGAYKFCLCNHYSCSCSLPFIRLLESCRPASTPSETWLKICSANLMTSPTQLQMTMTTTPYHLWRNKGVGQRVPILMSQESKKQRQKKSSVLDDNLWSSMDHGSNERSLYLKLK